MEYLSNWAFVDVLTVEQAACLWVGVDPSTSKYTRSPSDQSKIAPVVQAISGAIAGRQLEADSSTNAYARIGDYDKSLVTRQALRAFAESKGQRPAFLFDTLMAAPDEWANAPIVPEPAPEPPKHKGGRPAEYDWNAFALEIIRVADLDGLPETQAELVSQMLQWCHNSWGKEPAESSVKKRISEIYNGLGRGQKPSQG